MSGYEHNERDHDPIFSAVYVSSPESEKEAQIKALVDEAMGNRNYVIDVICNEPEIWDVIVGILDINAGTEVNDLPCREVIYRAEKLHQFIQIVESNIRKWKKDGL